MEVRFGIIRRRNGEGNKYKKEGRILERKKLRNDKKIEERKEDGRKHPFSPLSPLVTRPEIA